MHLQGLQEMNSERQIQNLRPCPDSADNVTPIQLQLHIDR